MVGLAQTLKLKTAALPANRGMRKRSEEGIANIEKIRRML
jgi:hypothetical protein